MTVNEAAIARLLARAGHSVDIERAVTTVDELGGRRFEWQTVTAGVSAWVQPAAADAREAYRRQGMTVTHTVYFAADPSVEAGDRISFDGALLVVSGVVNMGGLGKLWKADCREHA